MHLTFHDKREHRIVVKEEKIINNNLQIIAQHRHLHHAGHLHVELDGVHAKYLVSDV